MNPEHLFLGDQYDNMRDRAIKRHLSELGDNWGIVETTKKERIAAGNLLTVHSVQVKFSEKLYEKMLTKMRPGDTVPSYIRRLVARDTGNVGEIKEL